MSRELDRDMQGGGRLPGAATLQRSRVTHARSGRWWRSLRERGLVAAARAAARRVYRSHAIIVNRTDLRGPAVPDRVGDIVFRLATEADLDRLAQLDGVGRGSRQWAYVVEDNDWLFVACDGERIIATVRYGRTVRDPLASRVVRLGPTEVWAGDVFCLPEYRSRGVARQLLLYVWRWLAAQGYTDVLGAVAVGNTNALRIFARAGSRPFCHVSYVRLLFWERVRISSDIPGRFYADLR